MQVFKNNVSLEATPASDTHIVNKAYLEDRISKINVQHAVKVDELPICTDNGDGTYTITYIKDGDTKTTTDISQWFYYLDAESNLKQTIFLDGEELTIDGTEIVLDDFIEKSAIVTTLDSTVTNEQVVGALTIYNAIKDWDSAYNFDYVNSTSLNVNLAKAGLYKFSAITEGAPSDNPGDYTLLNIPWRKNQDTLRYGMQLLFSPHVEHFYFRRVWNYLPDSYTYTEGDYSVFGKWNVCGQKTPYTLGYEPSIVTEIKANEDLNNLTTFGVYVCKSYTIAKTLTNIPESVKNFAFKMEVSVLANNIYEQRIYNANSITGLFYVRNHTTAGGWSSWKKVCVVDVEDVNKTIITFDNTTNYSPSGFENENCYMVKNGICYMSLVLTCISASSSWIEIASGLPKNAFGAHGVNFLTTDSITSTDAQPAVQVTGNGTLTVISGTSGGKRGRIFFSFPVAEDWRP